MTKWEYHLEVSVAPGWFSHPEQPDIEKLGAEGWELISAQVLEGGLFSGTKRCMVFWFKRPIEEKVTAKE